jgi:hypothetical protein
VTVSAEGCNVCFDHPSSYLKATLIREEKYGRSGLNGARVIVNEYRDISYHHPPYSPIGRWRRLLVFATQVKRKSLRTRTFFILNRWETAYATVPQAVYDALFRDIRSMNCEKNQSRCAWRANVPPNQRLTAVLTTIGSHGSFTRMPRCSGNNQKLRPIFGKPPWVRLRK